MILIGALAAALAAASAPVASAEASSVRPYVSGFCGALTLNESDPAVVRQVLRNWNAQTSTAEAGEAYLPQDVDVPGQFVTFSDPAAPHAFVEKRRGVCSLVYSGDRVPASVISDLKTPLIPTGAGQIPSAWAHLADKRVGPSGPIRYFLQLGDVGRYGLCATIFEDVRLKDNAPAVLVRVQPCNLGAKEIETDG